MTKITNDKKKSGGKNKSKASNKQGFVFPKKVRTEISKFRGKLEAAEKEENSQLSFQSTTLHDNTFTHNEVIEHTYGIARLAGTCNIKRREVKERAEDGDIARFGNELYWQWIDEDMNWPRCARWDSKLLHYCKDELSWESAFTQVYADHSKRDWDYLERRLRKAGEKIDWVLRLLSIGIVQRCPKSVFDFDAPLQKGFSRYWDKSNPSNPRLLVTTRPFAKFWALCCEIFNFPWASPTVTAIPKFAVDLQSAARATSSSTPKRSLDDSDAENSQSTSARVEPNSPSRGGFPESSLKRVAENHGSNLSVSSSESLQARQSSTNRNPVTPGDDSSSKSSSSSESSLSDQKPPAKTSDPPLSETKPAAKTSDTSTQPPTSQQTQPEKSKNNQKTNKNQKQKNSQKKSTPPPVNQVSVNSSAQKQLTFDTPSKASKLQRSNKSFKKMFQSESEKCRTVRQIRMDGISRKNSAIFCLSVSVHWEGDEAEGEATVQDKIAEAITSRWQTALELYPKDLIFLPFSDYQFKQKERWITTKKKLESLTTFQQLRIYLDLKWQNGSSIRRAGQGPGNKILRSRIRVASDSSLAEIESLLNDLFSETGFNMGTFPSPLQAANAIRIGWLLNYPIGVDCLLLAQELMRLFDFQIPIALEAAYPINPTATGKNWKRGKRQALHVFTSAPRAPEVVQRLLTALSRETPKHDMPFGADTRFVYDWKAVRARTIGVDADPAISDFIVQMIATHDTFGSSTCLIRSPFTLTPLVQNSVPLFDEDMSLLRLLYAILCTPKQAQQASDLQAAEQTVGPEDQDDDVSMGKNSSGYDGQNEEEGQTGDAEDDDEGMSKADEPPTTDQQSNEQEPEADPTNNATSEDSSDANGASPSTGSNDGGDHPTQPDNKDNSKVHDGPSQDSTAADTTPNTPNPSTASMTGATVGSPEVPSPPRLRNTANLADGPSQQISSLTGTPVVLQAPAPTEESEEALRLRLQKKDRANLTPAPLFLAILPSVIAGYYIFLIRAKFRPLAENVLSGLAAFLTFHLELDTLPPEVQRSFLKAWVCKQHINRTRDYAMVWDPATLQVQSEYDKNVAMAVDERDEWLDQLDEKEAFQEVFEGTLTINLQLSSVRHMDDGSTVATRLREILRLKQVEAKFWEQEAQLEKKEEMLEKKEEELGRMDAEIIKKDHVVSTQQKEIERLQAKLAAQSVDQPEQHNESNAQADDGGGSSDADY